MRSWAQSSQTATWPPSAAVRQRSMALGGHDFQLGEAHVAGVGQAPGSAVGAEDIRDLQRWTGHEAEALA